MTKIQGTITITQTQDPDFPWLLVFCVPDRITHTMMCKTYTTALRASSLFQLDWNATADFAYSIAKGDLFKETK